MTTTLTPEQFVPTMIAEWCRQVRRMHGAWSTPILSEDDLRVQRMREGVVSLEDNDLKRSRTESALRHLAGEPERAVKVYFEFWADLPEPPLAPPAWAVRHSYTMMWPQVTVDFESAPIEVGDATAYLTQSWTIQVADKDYSHGPELAGTVWDSAPCLRAETDEESTIVVYEANSVVLRQIAGAFLLAADKLGGETR